MSDPIEPSTLKAVKSAFKVAADAVGLNDQGIRSFLGEAELHLERMGQFLAVYDQAENITGSATDWLRAPNNGAPFEGKPPLQFILEEPEENLPHTLHYLQGTYGGWA